MPHDVFISHAQADKLVADAVCNRLESAGIRCWIAPRDVLPGKDWILAIIDGITACRLMVLVFSEHTDKSQHVEREVAKAFERGLTVIPFRVKDIKPQGGLEYFLGTVHWLDALPPPPPKRRLWWLAVLAGLALCGLVLYVARQVVTPDVARKPGPAPAISPAVSQASPNPPPSTVGVYAEPKRYPAAVLVPGNEVSLKCLGNLPGPRYLDGRPADGSVGLAPRVKRDSGTKWRVVAAGEGAISLKCLGTIEGNRWLDGRTPDSSVGLAPNAEFPFTGARWQVLQEGDDPNLVHLRCLGHLQGPKFLDGNTTNGTVSLTPTLDPTGTKWEASLYPVNVGD